MNKNMLYKYMIITMLFASVILLGQINMSSIKDIIQTNISNKVRLVKITEEKTKISDTGIVINIKMPEVHCNNDEVERYINSSVRRDINTFINHKRQEIQLANNKGVTNISIGYAVVYENGNLLNIVINKKTNDFNDNEGLEKDSYVFDLKTGQRIYLDNLLKDNTDYEEVIYEYICDEIKEDKLSLDECTVQIDKHTNYSITGQGITIYINPYEDTNQSIVYEFNIPYQIFKNKIKILETEDIVANIDTQTITKNNKYINSIINIPIIMMKDSEVEKYINDKIREDIMEFYNNAQVEAKKYLGDYVEVDSKFIANVDFEVKKNSDDILSLVVSFYKYSGGAHGLYEDESYNLDIKNGELLELEDMFKDDIDYKQVIDSEIRKQIEQLVKEDEENKGIYQFNGINEDNNFYIQDDNLVIYFDLYEIAPYAAGQPEFLINISVISHILKEEYIDVFK